MSWVRWNWLKRFDQFEEIDHLSIDHLLISLICTTWIDLISNPRSNLFKTPGIPIGFYVLPSFELVFDLEQLEHLVFATGDSTGNDLINEVLHDLQERVVECRSSKQLTISND